MTDFGDWERERDINKAEMEEWTHSIAKSPVSCRKSQDKNNSKLTELPAGIQWIVKSTVSNITVCNWFGHPLYLFLNLGQISQTQSQALRIYDSTGREEKRPGELHGYFWNMIEPTSYWTRNISMTVFRDYYNMFCYIRSRLIEISLCVCVGGVWVAGGWGEGRGP